MRNLIIVTASVFIAIVITSYFYFSNLRKHEQVEQESVEIADADTGETEETSKNAAPLWTFDLYAEPISKPGVFSLDDARQFVLVQDAYHILYAISADGEKLWNAQLPGTIIGSIRQLADNSLLFTTAERLYRIDIEGDPLPGFSLRLPHKATGGGASVVYNDNGDVRIDVQAGSRILSFDDRGKRVQTRHVQETDASASVDSSLNIATNASVRLPRSCGPLAYYGPLTAEDFTYLLCGANRKLSCYRYND